MTDITDLPETFQREVERYRRQEARREADEASEALANLTALTSDEGFALTFWRGENFYRIDDRKSGLYAEGDNLREALVAFVKLLVAWTAREPLK